jgi:hypothetical protein
MEESIKPKIVNVNMEKVMNGFELPKWSNISGSYSE